MDEASTLEVVVVDMAFPCERRPDEAMKLRGRRCVVLAQAHGGIERDPRGRSACAPIGPTRRLRGWIAGAFVQYRPAAIRLGSACAEPCGEQVVDEVHGNRGP